MSLIANQSYNLNLQPGGVPVIVHTSQYDHGWWVVFTLYNGSELYTIPEGVSGTIRALRPDGTAYAQAVTVINGSSTVGVSIGSQINIVAGLVKCELVLVDSAGNRIGTANFVVAVEKAPIDDDAEITEEDLAYAEEVLTQLQSVAAYNTRLTAAESDIDDLETALATEVSDREAADAAEAELRAAADISLTSTIASTVATEAEARATADTTLSNAIAALQASVGSPLTASTVAAMTDTSKIYVYTGSESGYTSGNWYYYDGSAWVSGGVYNSQALETDTTLSVSGSAADAAATGSKVADLKSATEEIECVEVTPKLSETYAGVTFEWQSDGRIKAYGTATATRRYLCLNGQDSLAVNSTVFSRTLNAGRYQIETSFSGALASRVSWQYTYTTFASGVIAVSSTAPSATVTFTQPVMLGLYFASGTDFGTSENPTYITISAKKLNAVDDVLRSGLEDFNSKNYATDMKLADRASMAGIAWTFTPNTVTASGTASANTFYPLYEYLPDWMIPGETLYVKFNAENIYLTVYDLSSGEYVKIFETQEDAEFTVPATVNGTGAIRLRVLEDAVVSETVDLPAFLSSKPNGVLEAEMDELPERFAEMQDVIPTGTDIDTVTSVGYYFVSGSNTYTNLPSDYSGSGALEVIQAHENVIIQRLTKWSNGQMWVRLSSSGSFADRDWNLITGDVRNVTYESNHYENSYSITCSPTITTDTNNYLASTDDSTDRTGDIQTMLNTTGVCHLGPGDFYVTGVEIPNFGSLIGSGNATRLILASSVTDGYTVKLNNNCTVRDIRLMGDVSDYERSSTIGTRHGILYEGTADAASNPVSKYRCTVHNCWIWNYAGNAILCTNTGKSVNNNLMASDCYIYRCDAGINIAYYSEFHRFTNISVTHCYYGCIDNSGNCVFTNCSFSYNMVGILMDNENEQSPNNSHGTFSACTICHSGASNDGIAIKILNCDIGEIFNAMQIHYGSIIVDASQAIRFTGCQFGASVPMTLTNNTLITFSDCSFNDSPGTVTQSGNTTIAYDRCYKYNGTAYNPAA